MLHDCQILKLLVTELFGYSLFNIKKFENDAKSRDRKMTKWRNIKTDGIVKSSKTKKCTKSY